MATQKRQLTPASAPDEADAATTVSHYIYQNDQGEYYAGWPGPGATLTPEEYGALPSTVRRLFVAVLDAPTADAPLDGDKE